MSQDNLLYSALKELIEASVDTHWTAMEKAKQALTHYDTIQGEDKVAGHPNNKQWPTVTDNDFRKMYRSLEVAVESLKHHEFYNRDLIYVLELTLNENKHFKI